MSSPICIVTGFDDERTWCGLDVLAASSTMEHWCVRRTEPEPEPEVVTVDTDSFAGWDEGDCICVDCAQRMRRPAAVFVSVNGGPYELQSAAPDHFVNFKVVKKR